MIAPYLIDTVAKMVILLVEPIIWDTETCKTIISLMIMKLKNKRNLEILNPKDKAWIDPVLKDYRYKSHETLWD